MKFKQTIQNLFSRKNTSIEPTKKIKVLTDEEKEIRKKIAEKVRKIRKGERDKILFYIVDRSSKDYQYCFEGLKFFFDYVRSLKTKVVIDVGAGLTNAINEISKSELGDGIQFKATVLTRKDEIEKNLGLDKVVSTSIETLRGIKDSSIGGMLLGFSLPYVVDPRYALKSLDRVLIPGGVLKAFFQSDGIDSQEYKERGKDFHGYLPFKEILEKMGYDCAVSYNEKSSVVCILAIKPGSENSTSAQVLLDNDKNDLAWNNERNFY